jgi:hypothetical protein
MKLPLFLLALFLSAAACTPEGSEVTISSSEVAPPYPKASSHGPAGADNLTWLFDDNGQKSSPRLRYAAAEGEETAIAFECRTDGKVTVVLDRLILGRKPPNWPFTLISRGEEAPLIGKLSRKQDDHMGVEAIMPASAPILVAISLSGELSLDDSSRLSPLPMNAVNDDERQAIADFLSTCPLG